MRAVTRRIGDKLRQMEGTSGFMEQLDDFYPGEIWKGWKLADMWDVWIKDFIRDRVQRLDTFIDGKLTELQQSVTDARRQVDTSKAMLDPTNNSLHAVIQTADRSRNSRDRQVVTQYQGYFRIDRDQFNANLAEYQIMKERWSTLTPGRTSAGGGRYHTVSPL